jgi:hypothetical protein
VEPHYAVREYSQSVTFKRFALKPRVYPTKQNDLVVTFQACIRETPSSNLDWVTTKHLTENIRGIFRQVQRSHLSKSLPNNKLLSCYYLIRHYTTSAAETVALNNTDRNLVAQLIYFNKTHKYNVLPRHSSVAHSPRDKPMLLLIIVRS